MGCGAELNRELDWERHTLTFHLPDCLFCPNPTCNWRGHRKEKLEGHIKEGKCGPRPEWEEECLIYDPKLILQWILEESIPFEVAAMYALEFVNERARELGKVDVWRDPWPQTRNKLKSIMMVEAYELTRLRSLRPYRAHDTDCYLQHSTPACDSVCK